jgi:hypothetical protein
LSRLYTLQSCAFGASAKAGASCLSAIPPVATIAMFKVMDASSVWGASNFFPSTLDSVKRRFAFQK